MKSFPASAIILISILIPAFRISAAVIEVKNEVEGPTPDVLAYNLGSFTPGSNTSDWWRYSRVSGARMFLAPSHFNTPASQRFGDFQVTGRDSFIARREALRADPLDEQFINWGEAVNRFNTPLGGNNRIVPQYAFEQIQRHGGTAMGQLTLSAGAFPIDGEDDWRGKWIAWRTYYAIVFHMAREFDARRFTAFNEPNHSNSFIEPEPWLMRVRLASDATRSAIADVNRIYGKDLKPVFVAPVTASGSGPAYEDYGRPVVQSQHVDYLGQTSGFNILFHLYAYQQYSANPASFVSTLQNVRDLVNGDLPETSIPLRYSLTEFNLHTGANYDGMTDTPDTLSKATRFGTVLSQLMQHGLDEFYAFKFGMTAYPSTRNFPVQKNGMLYLDNDNHPYSYGTMTRGAEVYRLFNKAFAPGRERLSVTVSGAGASGLEVKAVRDPEARHYYVFSVNETSSAIPFELDLSALDVPDGNSFIVEDVSQWRRGTVRSFHSVENGQVNPGNQPAQTVWLITIPADPQRKEESGSTVLQIPVSQDTMVRDGIHSDTSFGDDPAAWARNHATDLAQRAAVFLQFDLPDDWHPDDLQLAVIEIPASPIAGGDETVHAHLYGIDNHDWDQSTLTWNNAPNLRKDHPTGNEICHGVVEGAGYSAHILGQLTARGGYTERWVDVTDYLIRQDSGKASFLISQDPRWDIDIHVNEIPESWSDLKRGDDQPDGIRIRTKESGDSGASLLLIRSPAGGQAINFSDWQTEYFTEVERNDPDTSGPFAIPFGDGVSNLLKYAFGIPPGIAGAREALPQIVKNAGELTFEFRRRLTASDVSIEVQVSDDLINWSEAGEDLEQISRVREGDLETVILRSLIEANAPRFFIRLDVRLE